MGSRLLVYSFGLLLFCGVAIADVEFGGVYQTCHGCSTQCMSPNLWTGGCTCPSGFGPSCFHAIAGGLPGYETQICYCEPHTIVPGGYYGGSYQILDNPKCGACIIGNRYSDVSCSCPDGYQPSSIRVFAKEEEYCGTVEGSHIVTCLKASGNGNFRGAFQTSQTKECISKNALAGEEGCGCPMNACAWSGSATIDDGHISTVSICTSSLGANPNSSTLEGKVLFGYQGWFSTPADKNVGWFHWSKNSNPPSGTNSNFDVWPELSEYGDDELYPTNLHWSGGSTVGLYLASSLKTITRHFQWMQTYGLDGILLQRFVNEVANHADAHFAMRNNVTMNTINAAAATGRVWAIEYDTSGADGNTVFDIMTSDWQYLLNTNGILKSPQYLHQNGKPVVTLWGFGFTGNSADPATALKIINWFKSNGVYVMGGVPYWWRTGCCDSQPGFLDVYLAYDLLMPWAVGRYGDPTDFQNLYKQVAAPDITYLQPKNIGYAPIIFPGFSWANMHGNFSIFNQIPRKAGSFFNAQADTYAKHPGVTFIKIAMFDEVDEGTAMFKAASTKAQTPEDGTFLYLSIDGTTMPSDAYLCLAGALTAKNGG